MYIKCQWNNPDNRNVSPVTSCDLLETLAQISLSHQVAELHVKHNTDAAGAVGHLHVLQALPRGGPALLVVFVQLSCGHLQLTLLLLLLAPLCLGVQPFLSLLQFLQVVSTLPSSSLEMGKTIFH